MSEREGMGQQHMNMMMMIIMMMRASEGDEITWMVGLLVVTKAVPKVALMDERTVALSGTH